MPSLRKALAIAAFLLPASAQGLKIQTDYDTRVDFLNFTTYSWSEGVRVGQDPLDQRIQEIVDSVLSRSFLRRIEANPDLYVTFHAASNRELVIDTSQWGYSFGAGWQWGGGMGQSTTTVQKYPKGTLVVDLWEAKTQRLVWRGVASGVIGSDQDKSLERVGQAVKSLFGRFPPLTRR